MAEIKVTPAMLRSSAQNFNSIENKFTSIMSQVKNDMLTMKNNWEGDAANSFFTRFTQLERSFATYSRVIKEYAAFLNKSATDYESTDKRVQNHNESISNNLYV